MGFANCLKLLHLIIVRPVKSGKAPFLRVVCSPAAFVRVPAAGQGSGLAGHLWALSCATPMSLRSCRAGCDISLC